MAISMSSWDLFLDRALLKTLFGIAIFTIVLVLRFVYFYRKACLQFPGPPVKRFWMGNLDQTMGDDIHKKWLKWNREYGHIFQTWNRPFSRVIYIGDPHIIAKIATSNWPKSSTQYEGFKPLSGDALFVQTDHERWKVQRKRLAPAFQPQIVDAQYSCLSKHLVTFVEILDAAAERNTVTDFASLHVLLTLDFIGDIAYGTDLHALSDGTDCRILHLLETNLPELMKCGLFPLRSKFPVMKKTREMFHAITELRGTAQRAIDIVRRRDGAVEEVVNERTKSRKIFEILAEQRESTGHYTFSSKELCDNYVAFLVAGADPTAHAMSFAIYEVAYENHVQLRHPNVLARLRAEVDASMPYDAMIPSFEQVRLPYLIMILKETLRIHSTGFGTVRICPVNTEVGGVTLPANSTLALWNPAVHRDPRLWEKPDNFDPDRWLQGHSYTKGSYFPLSYGPRNCIGQGLAMFEMTITLATLFRRYDLSLEPGFEMEYLPSFTLRPKNGLPIRVIRRGS